MTWLKWYPSRAQNSFRWQSLTLEERGLFHELYDMAALCTPRGALQNELGRIEDHTLAARLMVNADKLGALLARLLEIKLIVRTDAQVLVFPDFAAHQRNGPARIRGAQVAQKWRKSGAGEVEVEVEVEEEQKKKQTTDDAASGNGPAPPPPAPKPPKIDFDRGNTAWLNVTDKHREAWAKAFPACDLDVELARAAVWAQDNPKKAKKEWGRFLGKWLRNSQEDGGTRTGRKLYGNRGEQTLTSGNIQRGDRIAAKLGSVPQARLLPQDQD